MNNRPDINDRRRSVPRGAVLRGIKDFTLLIQHGNTLFLGREDHSKPGLFIYRIAFRDIRDWNLLLRKTTIPIENFLYIRKEFLYIRTVP